MKAPILIFLCLIIFSIAFGCKINKQNTKEPVKDKNNRVTDSVKNVVEDGHCSLTEDVPSSIVQIKNDPQAFNKKYGNQDNCYLRLLDTLTSMFITTSNSEYIECLNLIAGVCDGYVAEYFAVKILDDLSENKFIAFFGWIYTRNKIKNDALTNFFVEYLASQIQATSAKERDFKRKTIEEKFVKQLSTESNFEDKRIYLKKLLKKADKLVSRYW